MKLIRRYALFAAWVFSLAGFFLSLYFSEFEKQEPCRLCWLQRIALFPLVLQLGIAAFYSDAANARRYCLPLVVVGFFVALYQTILPELGLNKICKCAASSIPMLFETIPLPWLSAGGFLVIALLLLLSHPNEESHAPAA